MKLIEFELSVSLELSYAKIFNKVDIQISILLFLEKDPLKLLKK